MKPRQRRDESTFSLGEWTNWAGSRAFGHASRSRGNIILLQVFLVSGDSLDTPPLATMEKRMLNEPRR
jgi:hypothetical protein